MYVSKLSKLGYKLLPYESHFKFKGQEAIDIREEEENVNVKIKIPKNVKIKLDNLGIFL